MKIIKVFQCFIRFLIKANVHYEQNYISFDEISLTSLSVKSHFNLHQPYTKSIQNKLHKLLIKNTPHIKPFTQ